MKGAREDLTQSDFVSHGSEVGEASSSKTQKGLASFAAKLQRAKHSGEDLINSFASLLPSAQTTTSTLAVGNRPVDRNAGRLSSEEEHPLSAEGVPLHDVEELDAEALLQLYRQRKAEVRHLQKRLRELQDTMAVSVAREKHFKDSLRCAVDELGKVLRCFGVLPSKRSELANQLSSGCGTVGDETHVPPPPPTPPPLEIARIAGLPSTSTSAAAEKDDSEKILDWTSQLSRHLSRIERDRFSLSSFCLLLFPHCHSLELTAQASAAATSGAGDCAYAAALRCSPIDSEELRRLWLEMEEERLVGSAQLELQSELQKQRRNFESLCKRNVELEERIAAQTRENAQLLLRLVSHRKNAAAALQSESGIDGFHCLGCRCASAAEAEESPSTVQTPQSDNALSPQVLPAETQVETSRISEKTQLEVKCQTADSEQDGNGVCIEGKSEFSMEGDALSPEEALRARVSRLEEELRRHRKHAEKLLSQKDAALLHLKQRLTAQRRSSFAASPNIVSPQTESAEVALPATQEAKAEDEREQTEEASFDGKEEYAKKCTDGSEQQPPVRSSIRNSVEEDPSNASRTGNSSSSDTASFNFPYFKHVFLKYVHLKEKADPAAQQLLSVLSVLLELSEEERQQLSPQTQSFWWA